MEAFGLKPVRRSLRNALTLRFILLNTFILGVTGASLYLTAHAAMKKNTEDSMRRTTQAVFGLIESRAEAAVRNYLRASA